MVEVSTECDTTTRAPSGGQVIHRPVQSRLKYKGRKRIDGLQIINRGTDTVFDGNLSAPGGAAMDFSHATLPIPPTPGYGKYVTIDAPSRPHFFGGSEVTTAFDVTVIANTELGAEVASQAIFMELNG